jgi:hypothetical protein
MVKKILKQVDKKYSSKGINSKSMLEEGAKAALPESYYNMLMGMLHKHIETIEEDLSPDNIVLYNHDIKKAELYYDGKSYYIDIVVVGNYGENKTVHNKQ